MAVETDTPSAVDYEALRRTRAESKLSTLFQELGHTNIGEEGLNGETVTPLSIVTELRDQNPDLSFTRQNALTALLVEQQVTVPQAVEIGVLWGEAYGSSSWAEEIDRTIDAAGLDPDKRKVAGDMIVGTAEVFVKGMVALRDLENQPKELEETK